MTEKYDVFISYRRDGGAEMALFLSHVLRERGYRVFFDIEELRSGPFNTKLYDVIEGCTDFIAVLSPRCFERCTDANDWFRLEIAHALGNEKNVVPFMMRGFAFNGIPELPPEINEIRNMNGITASHEHTDATLRRLMKFLHSSPRPARKASTGLRKGVWAAMVLFILTAVVGVVSTSFLRESASRIFDGTATYTNPEERNSEKPPSPPATESKETVSPAENDELDKETVSEQAPEDIVRALYALHEKRVTHRDALTPVRSTDEDFVYSYFTRELGNRLISQERVYSVHQDISQIVLDFDPLYNGQDVSIEEFHVAPSTINGKTARVDVHFKNFETPTKLVFRLLSSADGWRIDDIEYPNSQKSLRALLQEDPVPNDTAIMAYPQPNPWPGSPVPRLQLPSRGNTATKGTCPQCGGAGTVEKRQRAPYYGGDDSESRWYTILVPCPLCGETGEKSGKIPSGVPKYR